MHFTTIFILCALQQICYAQINIPETDISASGAGPNCQLKIEPTDKNGNAVASSTLDDELFWRISCTPLTQTPSGSYCLVVSDCTVSNGLGESIQVIDKNGCSALEYLFDHPIPESDTVTVIRNPYPIRFRDSPIVRMNCVASLNIRPVQGCPSPVPAVAVPNVDTQRGHQISVTSNGDLEVADNIAGATVNPVRVTPKPTDETQTPPSLIVITPNPQDAALLRRIAQNRGRRQTKLHRCQRPAIVNPIIKGF